MTEPVNGTLRQSMMLHAKQAEMYARKNQEIDASRLKMEKHFSEIINNWFVTKYTVLNVGPTRPFKSIQAAWNSLKNKILLDNVLIKVDPGTYTAHSINLIDHPFSERIRIEGDLGNPAACNIVFVADENNQSHGIIARNIKSTFGGFLIEGEANSSHWTHRALYLENCVFNIPDGSVKIRGVGNGLEVINTYLNMNGLHATEIHHQLARLTTGSIVNLNNLHSELVDKTILPSFLNTEVEYVEGHGVLPVEGSKVWSSNSRIFGGNVAFMPHLGGWLSADHSIAENCKYHGFLNDHGTLYAQHAKAKDCTHSFYTVNSGFSKISYSQSINASSWAFVSTGKSNQLADHSTVQSGTYGYVSDQQSFTRALNTLDKNNAEHKYSADNGQLHNTCSIVHWS